MDEVLRRAVYDLLVYDEVSFDENDKAYIPGGGGLSVRYFFDYGRRSIDALVNANKKKFPDTEAAIQKLNAHLSDYPKDRVLEKVTQYGQQKLEDHLGDMSPELIEARKKNKKLLDRVIQDALSDYKAKSDLSSKVGRPLVSRVEKFWEFEQSALHNLEVYFRKNNLFFDENYATLKSVIRHLPADEIESKF